MGSWCHATAHPCGIYSPLRTLGGFPSLHTVGMDIQTHVTDDRCLLRNCVNDTLQSCLGKQ